MDVAKTTILGNSALGVFATATNKYAILPYNVKKSVIDVIKSVLEVPTYEVSISNSVLLGTLTAGNSKILFVPPTITAKEQEIITSYFKDLNVEIIEIETKYTALGNLILMNDKGAIISDLFEKPAQKAIKDYIDGDAEVGQLLNSPLVGTIGMCTNRGCLVHPLLSQEELNEISSLLKVPVDLCTVNRGIPYPKVGMLANSYGAVVGVDTTGPESMRIFEVLLSQ